METLICPETDYPCSNPEFCIKYDTYSVIPDYEDIEDNSQYAISLIPYCNAETIGE